MWQNRKDRNTIHDNSSLSFRLSYFFMAPNGEPWMDRRGYYLLPSSQYDLLGSDEQTYRCKQSRHYAQIQFEDKSFYPQRKSTFILRSYPD